ncbi:hypothetical protein AB0A60_15080 [Streptomyces sp. NPDC046275]|uniref:hypothetical protein n=1 Tax=Streptomyces sp. NPDC046275 TaxID=3157201 RepID=UPI0033C00398
MSYQGEGQRPNCVDHADYADFAGTGIRALFSYGLLGCVAVAALVGPQVRRDGAPLTGCEPSRVEDWLVRRPARPGSVSYSVAGDPVFADLGLRSARSGRATSS